MAVSQNFFLVVLCCRYFGFVVFETKDGLDKVLDPEKVDKHVIDGRNVNMKKAVPHAIHQVSSVRWMALDVDANCFPFQSMLIFHFTFPCVIYIVDVITTESL